MNIVLGYHGCSKEAAQELLGGSPFKPSNKPYDWLGEGSYFWEEDIQRASEWARERRATSPCVVGAVVDLGNCLDLTKRNGAEAVRLAYNSYVALQAQRGQALPQNERIPGSSSNELLIRHLDRAVIDHLHANYRLASNADGGKTKEFDTVRALFPEGRELYASSGFLEKTHVQIAVRKQTQILGVFRIPRFQLEQLNMPDLYDF